MMYEYLNGDMVYGDDLYTPEGYMGERWWYIDDFPDYMISDHGRVWSNKTQRFLKVKPMDDHGHFGVCLYKNGKTYYKYIHRLIANAFIPNNEKLPNVCHIDDNPDYNYYKNLKWGTQKDNHRDCVKNGHSYTLTDADRRRGIEKCSIPVKAVKMSNGEEYVFKSIKEASIKLNLQQSNVWKVLRGQRYHTGGWRFEEV